MTKFLGLALLGFSSMAFAQTPAANWMPDGSKDLYVGLGIESQPRYEGSSDQRTQAAPVVQMQWSNGIFWSGLSAGMHLSEQPGVEYGPLFAIDPGRSHTSIQILGTNSTASPPASASYVNVVVPVGRADVTDTGVRAEFGGFFNYYLHANTRIATNLLFGSGENHDGMVLTADMQHSMSIGSHHTFAVSAGLTWVNREYVESYYGVAPETIVLTSAGAVAQDYAPRSGIKDVHAGAHWNWALSNTWLLTSQLTATRLTGSAADSPLTDKRTNVTFSTALAYRF
jgi:outer membrane scaffolding protein for murein synthesis (MipA/OmpV family)